MNGNGGNEEDSPGGARVRETFVPPFTPDVLPRPPLPFTPSGDLPPNVTVTEKAFYGDDNWFTMTIYRVTTDDGVVEYHVVTRSDFTNNVMWTGYIEVTADSIRCLASNSIRTCPMFAR